MPSKKRQKLRNLNAMFVTGDNNLIEKAKRAKFKNLFIAKSEDFIGSYLNANIKIDIIVLDITECEFDLACIFAISPNQQFIFLAQNRKIYLRLLENFRGGNSVVLFKPIKFSAILDNIFLLNRTNSTPISLHLNSDITIKDEQIYKNGVQIFLTPMLHKLLLLFSSNLNCVVSFEMIENALYHESPGSKIALQNLVGKLKRTLNLDIKNAYGKGYILTSERI